MQTPPVPEGRQSQRLVSKMRSSLVVKHASGQQHRLPCLIIDASQRGFRLRASAPLRRGTVVEVVSDDDSSTSMQCKVIWVGRAGSKHEGEVGLERL